MSLQEEPKQWKEMEEKPTQKEELLSSHPAVMYLINGVISNQCNIPSVSDRISCSVLFNPVSILVVGVLSERVVEFYVGLLE